MDSNCNCQQHIEKNENKNETKAQCIPDRCRNRDVAGIGGIDTSLLFFFLILVCIACQTDCGIELDTLLWFFLLLVCIIKQCDC